LRRGNFNNVVMAGLVPAIHVFVAAKKEDVDARHKAGHDEMRYPEPGFPKGLPPRYFRFKTISVFDQMRMRLP
jgi:hypothetical protein